VYWASSYSLAPSERAIEDRADHGNSRARSWRSVAWEVNSYPEFYRWTVDPPGGIFWSTSGTSAASSPRAGLSVLVDGDKMPGAALVPRGALNFAEGT